MEDYIKIRNELTVNLVYLQLMTSITPKKYGGISNKEIRSSLIEVSEFIKNAKPHEIVKKGSILIKSLKKMVDWYKNNFPPKLTLEQIAEEFNSLFLENKDVYSYGLEYGWLQRMMDCSNTGFPEDLPFHARIGLAHHAGFCGVAEEFLLRDAFFIFLLAEESYKGMHTYAKYWQEAGKTDDPDFVNEVFGTANHNVAAYCRLSIVSFFSFVEAFVNSVGYDFSARHKDILSPQEIEILHGKKKDRYLSLEYKIEKFPSVIRPDKKTPIILSDYKQIREPFTTFIESIKKLRDSSVHYSPQKEAIWRKPDDWLNEAKTTSKLCLEVSQQFWISCYPNKGLPQYLGGLDYDKHIKIAKERYELQLKNQRF